MTTNVRNQVIIHSVRIMPEMTAYVKATRIRARTRET
jgi:hypothetical protein